MFVARRKWITAQISCFVGLLITNHILIHSVETRTNTIQPNWDNPISQAHMGYGSIHHHTYSYLHVFLPEVEFGCVLAAATAAKLPTTWLFSPELGELLLGVDWDNEPGNGVTRKVNIIFILIFLETQMLQTVINISHNPNNPGGRCKYL
jgi:hypothetical protein